MPLAIIAHPLSVVPSVCVVCMTRDHIALVQQSFYALQSSGKARIFAMRFYARLFLLNAPLYYLFPVPIEESEDGLLHLISSLVDTLDNPSTLLVQTQAYQQQCNNSFPQEHYAIVEDALLWALEKELGIAYTPTVRQAWEAVYSVVVPAIVQAACTAQPLSPYNT